MAYFEDCEYRTAECDIDNCEDCPYNTCLDEEPYPYPYSEYERDLLERDPTLFR